VLAEMLKLRIEHAHLLGYKTHADYKTELRMAKSGDKELAYENRLAKFALASFVAIFAVQAVLYFTVFRNMPKFIDTYGSVILLSAISVVSLVFAYYHATAFRRNATCMMGMMTGMTFGMAGGFMIGAFVGATNGMFIGSLAGMAVGIALGLQAGRCCGVMGVMEGVMGGVMAGTMGAMISVMMIFDNLIPFLYILTAIELVTLWLFAYMLYKEYGAIKEKMLGVNGLEFAVFCLAMDILVTIVMVYGPKAGVVLKP
ncbi:MAG TPA: hypothetical protein PLO51_05250, partial [Candidatus Micrarchaeota archaeon]|nr:hypothetical protein [Candidatus Micrarchaeota archaeon]